VNACNGANGGDGCPAGLAGEFGSDDSNQTVGVRGKDGSKCANCGPPTFLAPIYFPTFPGDSYTYQFTKGGQTSQFDLHVLPKIVLPGGSSSVVPFDLQIGNPPIEQKSYYSSDGTNGLQKYGTDSFTPPGGQQTESIRDVPPLQIPNGLGIGQFQNQSITETDSITGQPPQTQTYMFKTTFIGIGSVTVPAGTYNDVIQMEREVTVNSQLIARRMEWYAPWTGLIRVQNQSDNSLTELVTYTPTSRAAMPPGRGRMNPMPRASTGSASQKASLSDTRQPIRKPVKGRR
jgi:hypothetical protein